MQSGLNTGLQISMLASGSTGNATFIQSAQRKILVDAGLSGKKVIELLQSIGVDANELDAIFVTHEHTDHIKGVGVLARKFHLPVYANEGTWQAMEHSLGKIQDKEIFEMGKTMTFGDIDIESFGVSHDAAAPQFYRFHKDQKSFVMLTDTGYCSDAMRGIIKNADAYLMESNHDLEMLRMGSYPWPLKQRILGDYGHLSNDDGADVMQEVLGDKTKRIYLGHLSRENNLKEIAHLTMENNLREHDLGVDYDFKVYDTDPEEATPLFSL
ncbi:MBL fold metallo-hydrolase [Enterococcus timonensis]|uniref:MBL fold metallo-hydrolase n=1 Tax=Enterococcus timonensis TaxID=1852364 RepID=UPI0008DA7AC9|nr:MBL fold metallo-hydrolase [Enterococcus timonensis]